MELDLLFFGLILLHLERPTLYTDLDFLCAIGLNMHLT